ncbi:methyltransferase [Streptomyces leeuwenhoekii]|uniref:methyltransferase n=1 Tax=Streptomyces leeuwenhoekii TaxID=1437453 RepID=UPI0036FBD4EF
MPQSHDRSRLLDRFHTIVNGPALFNALVAGAELGLFEHLSRHPEARFKELCETTGVPAHQLRVLLFALCSTGLVRREGEGYVNSDVAEELLAPQGEDSWRHILVGWQRIYYPALARTTEALKAGTNTALADYPGTEPTFYQRLAHSPEVESVFHAAMTAFTLRSLPGLLDHLDLSEVRHVLDVGGGDGTTSKKLAEKYPNCRFTVFDTPSVAELADRSMPADLGERVALCPGDLFSDPFPQDVDCVLFSHCLEVFSPEQIGYLMDKAFDALAPGGRIHLYGFTAMDDEQTGMYGARLSLYLNVLATGSGMSYPADDYERWLTHAGFTAVGSVTGLPYEHTLTSGTKPGE